MTGIVLRWQRQHPPKLQTEHPPLREPHWRAALQLRLFTLGGFRVLFNEQHLRKDDAGATPATDLLKVIVALGGRRVPENKIAAALWPCADREDACARYDAALTELRSWLAGTAVLLIENGTVSLDERHCWVDTWALDRCCARIRETLSDTRRWPYEWQYLAVQTERLLRLYRGDFLHGERAQAWSFALRERLRHHFVRTLTQVSTHWRRIGDAQRAMHCCRAALTVDPLAEPLYQLLVQCLMEQGRLREAVSHYQDYRTHFVELFGVEPNPDAFGVLCAEPQEIRLP